VNHKNPTKIEWARAAYLKACDLEIRALKPGNVGDHAPGHDMQAEDFRHSASVSVAPLTDTSLCVGERIYQAVAATRVAVGCNTNLGIILLAAPLIAAFFQQKKGQTLRECLIETLNGLDDRDAEWLFQAIAHAKPGGLGDAPEADVNQAPKVSILEAMTLAEERDFIARQYTRSFEDIFQTSVPLYDSRLSIGDSEEWATAAVFLGLLSQHKDSHVERKFGTACADQVTREASLVYTLLAGPVDPEKVLGPLLALDRTFKADGINPGTTADLTVATLLVAQLDHWPMNEI
jgi:triphosphoribosyl-dephospho-CoA synthase